MSAERCGTRAEFLHWGATAQTPFTMLLFCCHQPSLALHIQMIRLTQVVSHSLAAALLFGAANLQAQSGLRLGEEPSGPVLDLGAQRSTDDGAGAASSAPSQGSASGASLDPGAAALNAGPGGELERTVHGDWEVACAANGQCAMAQIGQDAAGTPVLEMVIRKLPEPLEVGDRTAIAVLDVVTPLGVVLTEGLGLTIDSGRTESAPFQICTEQGCLVREPIDADLVQRLQRGGKARISMVAANQGVVESDISLTGFTAAYKAVK